MPRVFYRVVKTDPPTLRDFLSNAAKGLHPRGPEVQYPELHTGISVFDSVEGIELLRRRTPLRGFVAELVVPDAAPIRVEKTLGPNHCTIWGDAATLLGYMTRIV